MVADVFFIAVGIIAFFMSLQAGFHLGLMLISLLIIGRHALNIYLVQKKETSKQRETEKQKSDEEVDSLSGKGRTVALVLTNEETGESNKLIFNESDRKYIGRSQDADIRIEDNMVGKLSCSLTCENGEVVFRNMSLNGAWILNNNAWIQVDDGVKVKVGDTIKVVTHIFKITEG